MPLESDGHSEIMAQHGFNEKNGVSHQVPKWFQTKREVFAQKKSSKSLFSLRYFNWNSSKTSDWNRANTLRQIVGPMNSIVVPKRNVFDCILVDFLSAGKNKNHCREFQLPKGPAVGFWLVLLYEYLNWLSHPFKKVCSLNWITSLRIGVRKKNTPKAPSSSFVCRIFSAWPLARFPYNISKIMLRFHINLQKKQDSNSYRLIDSLNNGCNYIPNINIIMMQILPTKNIPNKHPDPLCPSSSTNTTQLPASLKKT